MMACTQPHAIRSTAGQAESRQAAAAQAARHAADARRRMPKSLQAAQRQLTSHMPAENMAASIPYA